MRARDERGAATVLGLAVLCVLLLLGCALGVVAAMIADHRRAQAAADLAVLAAAQTLASGGDPCGAAARVAVADGASVDSCAVVGDDVVVAVTVTGPHWLGQAHDLTARARAGPS